MLVMPVFISTLYIHLQYCFNVSLYTANNYVTPSVHLPGSLFREQETDQIVVRAEIRSPISRAFGSWRHGNISYINHIEEDPFCDSDVEVSSNMCSSLSHMAKQYETHVTQNIQLSKFTSRVGTLYM